MVSTSGRALTRRAGVSVAAMTANVTAWYGTADDTVRAEGRAWYATAHELCASMARDSRRPLSVAAGVVAALSPQVEWSRNLELARRALSDGRASGALGGSCRKADAVLAGSNVLDVLRGPKTRAFYTAILTAGTEGTAVIDTWAVRAATLLTYSQVSPRAYPDVAYAYASAAMALDAPVHHVQATVWLAIRSRQLTLGF
jgi:hypothetical protein